MNRSPSKARRPATAKTKPQPCATIVSAEELAMWRDVRLCQCAVRGDINAAITWLTKYGGPEWQPRGTGPDA